MAATVLMGDSLMNWRKVNILIVFTSEQNRALRVGASNVGTSRRFGAGIGHNKFARKAGE